VRDSRFHNYPPRWNGAPSQEILVMAQPPHGRAAALGAYSLLVRRPERRRQAYHRQGGDGEGAPDLPQRLPAGTSSGDIPIHTVIAVALSAVSMWLHK
jgi:hypothetical protein